MSVRYALMTLSPEPVEQDPFVRAFRGVPGLTSVDANQVGNPEGGLLVRNLTLNQAMALQSNLKATGTETEVVPEMACPLCPKAK